MGSHLNKTNLCSKLKHKLQPLQPLHQLQLKLQLHNLLKLQSQSQLHQPSRFLNRRSNQLLKICQLLSKPLNNLQSSCKRKKLLKKQL